MKALRYYGRRDVRLDEVPEPVPRRDQVKIRVEAAGICGSDVHEYRGGPISVPTAAPHALTGDTAPVVLGHEFAGTVVELGPEVQTLQVGQRVAVDASIWCGTCHACTSRQTNVCASIGFHGVSGEGGAFAPFDVVRERSAHVLPPALDGQAGALLEPLATALHAVARGGFGRGDAVLVLGGGPIGLCLALAARERGAQHVVLVEPSPSRREAAARFGATLALDPGAADVAEAIEDLTGGRGVACAFDAAAGRGTFHTAMSLTRTHGTVVNVAAWEQPVEFNPTSLLFREVNLTGSLAYTREDFALAVEVGARNVERLQSMVTSVVALDDLVCTFERLADDPGQSIKVLVEPGTGA